MYVVNCSVGNPTIVRVVGLPHSGLEGCWSVLEPGKIILVVSFLPLSVGSNSADVRHQGVEDCCWKGSASRLFRYRRDVDHILHELYHF